jgi:predicted PhzF superfamily epimerase YddE/YHI9
MKFNDLAAPRTSVRVESGPVKLTIDNGKDRIVVDFPSLMSELKAAGITEQELDSLLQRLKLFETEVRLDKSKGIHSGSSDLMAAVASELFVGLNETFPAETLLSCVKNSSVRFSNKD